MRELIAPPPGLAEYQITFAPLLLDLYQLTDEDNITLTSQNKSSLLALFGLGHFNWFLLRGFIDRCGHWWLIESNVTLSRFRIRPSGDAATN